AVADVQPARRRGYRHVAFGHGRTASAEEDGSAGCGGEQHAQQYSAMRRLPTAPVVLAGVAAFLDLYSTQPLLPLLRDTFGASTLEAGLTITAPTIAVALFAPFIGRLADRLGLRRMIVMSAWALTVATALAAPSHRLQQLIVWRFVQGISTPGIFASTVAYIHEVWPPTHAGRATAAYMTGTIVGGFTGRAVSGLMAADATWQMAFVALAILTAGV